MVKKISLYGRINLIIDEKDLFGKIFFNEHVLFDDYMYEGLLVLYNMLLNIKRGRLELDSKLVDKGLGYWWNKDENEGNNIRLFDFYGEYWLWSTEYVQTWLYRIKNQICIEISPSYPWHFSEPSELDEYFSFEKFLDNYTIIEKLFYDIDEIEKMISKLSKLMDNIMKY